MPITRNSGLAPVSSSVRWARRKISMLSVAHRASVVRIRKMPRERSAVVDCHCAAMSSGNAVAAIRSHGAPGRENAFSTAPTPATSPVAMHIDCLVDLKLSSRFRSDRSRSRESNVSMRASARPPRPGVAVDMWRTILGGCGTSSPRLLQAGECVHLL